MLYNSMIIYMSSDDLYLKKRTVALARGPSLKKPLLTAMNLHTPQGGQTFQLLHRAKSRHFQTEQLQP